MSRNSSRRPIGKLTGFKVFHCLGVALMWWGCITIAPSPTDNPRLLDMSRVLIGLGALAYTWLAVTTVHWLAETRWVSSDEFENNAFDWSRASRAGTTMALAVFSGLCVIPLLVPSEAAVLMVALGAFTASFAGAGYYLAVHWAAEDMRRSLETRETLMARSQVLSSIMSAYATASAATVGGALVVVMLTVSDVFQLTGHVLIGDSSFGIAFLSMLFYLGVSGVLWLYRPVNRRVAQLSIRLEEWTETESDARPPIWLRIATSVFLETMKGKGSR